MSTLSSQDAATEVARSFRDERQQWRERTLQGLLVSTLVATGFATAWFSLVPYGVPRLTLTLYVVVVALAAVILARRHAPFGLRATALLMLLGTACFTSTLSIGLNPNAVVGYAAVAVAAALLFGLKPAIYSVAGMALLLVGVSAGHASGAIQQAPNWVQVLDSAHLPNGLRVAGIFSLLASSIVVGISYLLERTEALVLRQAEALQALRSEQAEKERLRRDLGLREVALGKARELETLGRLAGSMAHDFNNALLVIWAAVEELADSPNLSDSDAEAVALLRAAADQATATTRNLRAFGPLSPQRPCVLELSSVITRARTTLERVLPPNISLASDVQLEAAVAADEGQLLRVLTNLALNARDAMRDGGTLTLRVRAPSASEGTLESAALPVAIDVADTGTGMAEDVKQRLFEPFFTTKEAGGTGLGLATVREVARAHGATFG
jgi:signal transduction histidine kinase